MSAKVASGGPAQVAQFVGGSYAHRSPVVDCELTLNKYPEYMESAGARVPSALMDTPGLHQLSEKTGRGGCRCAYTTSTGRLFMVFASAVFELDATFDRTLRFGLAGSTGRVTMVDNGTQLFICDGATQQGWIYDLVANTATRITSPGYPGGSFAIFIDGLFGCEVPGSQKWQWSALADGLSWPALNFVSAEGFPDAITALACVNLEVWAFGSKSVEVFYHSQDPTFPFQRFPSAVIPIGTTAPWSVASISGTLFWIGSDGNGFGSVWMSQGHGLPKRISTYAEEYQIGKSAVSDASAYCYSQEGHTFYVLNLPSASKTIVYDVGVGEWHNRGYMVPETGVVQRHLGECLAFFNGKNIVGDYRNDTVYWFDLDWYLDGTTDRIRRARRFPTYHADRAMVSYWSLEIMMETGVAPITGVGSDPQMMLRISNDGGRTWPGEFWRSMGKQGEFTRRVRWPRQLGSARERVFEVVSTEPVKQPWLACYVDAVAVSG